MIVEHLIKLTFGINCDQKDHIQRICGMIFKSLDNFLHPLFRGFPIRKFHREPPRFPGASLFDKTYIHGISIRGKNHFHNALNKFSDCFHSCIVLFLNCLSSFCLHPRHALYPFSIEQLHFLGGPPGCGLPDDGCFQDFKERGIIPLHVAFRAFLILVPIAAIL